MEIQRLRKTISLGIEFLATRQQAPGNFAVRHARNPALVGELGADDSVFATSCILYCLEWIRGGRIEALRTQGLAFLRAEVNAHGLCRYYAQASRKQIGSGLLVPFTIFYDVDTTACVSVLLRRYGVALDNADLLAANRDEEGLFKTWLMDEPVPERTDGFPALCLVPRLNAVCAGVNANVLFYLGQSGTTIAAAQHLQNVFSRGVSMEASTFYADTTVLAYLFSRAYLNSTQILGGARERVVKDILVCQRNNGAFGTPLQTALAVSALVNLGCSWPGWEAAIRCLIGSQRTDGAWCRGPFYVGDYTGFTLEHRCGQSRYMDDRPLPTRYFGSEEITTAFCLEALSRFAEAR